MSIYSRPYTFIAVIFAACIVPLSNGHAELVDTSLDVMTFNIRADFDFGAATSKPNAWISTVAPHRRDLVIDVIEDYGPDILGVQEAFRNQVNDLSAALPGYGFYGVGRNNGATFGEHSGIFFRNDRFTATQQGTFWLSNTPNVVGSVFPGRRPSASRRGFNSTTPTRVRRSSYSIRIGTTSAKRHGNTAPA